MRDFLDFVMLPGGFVELRAIHQGRVRRWWEKDRQAASDLAIKLSDDGWDAYYGVLPRRIHGGTTEDVSPFTRTLWADLDDKVHGDKRTTLMSIIDFDMAPSVIVDSGHGYHVYWRLDTIIPFAQAKAIMMGIAKVIKGDHVYDAARILRIPGTVNYKNPQAPVPVRTVLFNTHALCRPGDFHQYEYLGNELLTPAPRQYVMRSYRALEVPQEIEAIIREGAPQGQRSEAAWGVMCALIERGWSDDDIRAAFDSGGIGDKMREMRDGGERWFRRSLDRARAQASR